MDESSKEIEVSLLKVGFIYVQQSTASTPEFNVTDAQRNAFVDLEKSRLTRRTLTPAALTAGLSGSLATVLAMDEKHLFRKHPFLAAAGVAGLSGIAGLIGRSYGEKVIDNAKKSRSVKMSMSSMYDYGNRSSKRLKEVYRDLHREHPKLDKTNNPRLTYGPAVKYFPGRAK